MEHELNLNQDFSELQPPAGPAAGWNQSEIRVKSDHVATLSSHSQKYGKRLGELGHYEVTVWCGGSWGQGFHLLYQTKTDTRVMQPDTASLSPIFIGQYQGITHSGPLLRCPNR